MKIYWVRHGEAENNTKNIFNENPSKKIFLTEKGKEQVRILADKLKEANFEVIFTSEFTRTKQTANIINEFHKVKLIENKLINERKTGYEGKNFFEVLPLIKKEILGEGGEKIEELNERVLRFMKNLETEKYKSVLIVTHMAVLQIVKGLIENLSNEELRKLNVEHTEIIEINL